MIQIIIFLLLVFAVSLVAKRLDGSIVTGPMVFMFAGISAYFVAPLVASYLPRVSTISVSNSFVLQAGEVTLAIVLFGDATRISFKQAIAESKLPSRLLLIGMPLTILAGTLIAYGLFDEVLPFWEAAILATILAPTDASLGAVVVNSPLVPQRIREALSVESGLNDGLSMPFFVLFLALAGYEMHGHSHTWVQFTVMQIGFGVLVGFIVGWLGGKLMNWSERKNWMHEGAHLIALLALAVLAWGLANSVGGNGFIAAFVAGSTLRWAYNNAIDYAEEFEDSWGHLLVYFIFFAFGMLAAPWLENITPTIWLYGILSLTLVRMVPVALALSGSKLRPGTILYMGWFGPRGLASVVLGMIYLEELTLLNINQSIILAVIATVLLSVLAHGVSAAPLSQIYARYLAKQPSDAPEFV
jgi:NhaP-type Na+/H+ or K+/H+ antiporter